jgi:hypothetical protein
VLLVERYGFLGGAATISGVLTYCGFFDQQRRQVVFGVGEQVLERFRARGAYQEAYFAWSGNTFVLLDNETVKIVLDEVTQEAGVEVRLHSQVIGATVDDRKVVEVEYVDHGGRHRVEAAAFVDGSGDGDLSHLADAPTRVAALDERQTSTLCTRIGGVSADADLSADGLKAAVGAWNATADEPLPRDTGVIIRLPVGGEVHLQIIDELVDGLDARSMSEHERNGRVQTWQYLKAFRRHLHGFSDAYLIQTGPQLGIRESRHLVGRTQVTRDDVIHARKRPDEVIALCGWPIEDHRGGPGKTAYTPIDGRGHYDIGYDSIRARDVDNLFACGRLTSADDDAYASLRVQGTAFATGHGAGIAAALLAATGHPDTGSVQKELRRQHAMI